MLHHTDVITVYIIIYVLEMELRHEHRDYIVVILWLLKKINCFINAVRIFEGQSDLDEYLLLIVKDRYEYFV